MTSRQQRQDEAINSSLFNPHELSFEQLVVWAHQFAQQLPFKNLQDQADGHWGNLFQKSEIVVCAAISTCNTKQIQEQFQQAQAHGGNVAVEFLLILLKRLQEWYQHLPGTPETAYQFKYYLLHEYQYHLSLPLSLMITRLPEQFHHHVQALDPLWNLDQQTLDTASSVLQHSSFSEQTRHCFAKIVYVIEQIKQQSQQVLQAALVHQENNPQQALYFAFLQLFERAQQSLNQFTEKHLQFYYQQVLQQSKKATPDNSVYLKLSLNNQTNNSIQFEQGAEFSPGDDPDFNPIIYRSGYPIEVTDAEVSHLFNLTLQRDPLVSPEKESGLVCGVSGQRLLITASATGDDFPKEQHFNIFNNKYKTEDSTQPMGLIITDPLFSMQQGNRSIEIVIHLKEVRSGIVAQELLAVDDDDKASAALTRIFTQLLTLHAYLLENWAAQITASKLVKEVTPDQLNQFQHLRPSQRVWVAYKLFYLQMLQVICSTQDKGVLYGLSKTDLLFRVIGQIVSRRCLYTVSWLAESDIAEILTRLKPILAEEATAYTTIKELLSHSLTAAFYQLFQDVFHLEASTENGWEVLDNVEIYPCSANECQIGFRVKCHVDTGFASIIPRHAHLPHSASLKITLKRQSNCFPYAIFRDFELSKLAMSSHVSGVTQMQLFTPEGQVDSSQPFFLFGSQPYLDAYVVIANEEIARKSLSQLSLHLDWGNLPRGSEGFRQYYAQYPYQYTNASFQMRAAVLDNGQWVEFGPTFLPLFTPASGVLHHDRHLHFPKMRNSYTPVARPWPKTPYSNQSGLRNGLFKLMLTGPEPAFGHKDYAPLLSDTLTYNVSKKHKRTLPNQPYAPLVTRIAIDYSAESTIDLLSIDNHSQSEIVHLHPFGENAIYPPQQILQLHRPRFFPNYQEDSHCFIGITATELSGYLNIFFVFDGNARLLMPYPSTAYRWYYLVENEWQALNPHQIIHDTTLNFLTTGIVTLDLPDDINTDHTVMPSGLFWLRVSTNKGIDRYPDCLHVATHVVKVSGKGAPLADDGVTPLSFSAWRSTPRKANLAAIAQLNAMIKIPETESDKHFQMRISESLRHKGKALTPWDYEHLILENFPEVGSVHCFPTRSYHSHAQEPGRVLVIVTPVNTHCDHSLCSPKQLDSSYLLAIRRFLLAVSRPHVQIEVRHPGYEKIQIRCKVTLKEGVSHGPALRRLEYAIKSQLCPWESGSLNSGLGFCLSLEKLSAFILRQKNVVKVSALSALKISIDEDTEYTLQDSATTNQPIRAAYPWYLLIPEVHQYIQISPDNLTHRPVTVGIGELVIGEQFIVSTSTTSNPKGAKNNG
ncbi:hypothetical protein [Candidatus Symbiopectobacterium sp. NZEC151]|uniref:hypothetical protein n=2 Tax=unclassified Symbiopectobacterium TaxID=2794573 RepID=UPI002226A9B9|nr:hypothetical protein [Candidatus Symbiopectobacterium sp. NZEC151]MCW2473919.1 hypothetical protein [Candidatus Symbiopectobacterium sp. NZEC151]